MSENVVAVRSIEIVTAEINTIRDNARKVFLDAVVQIGTRLEEAKQLVPQGEWTAYLTDKLGYKPTTAQNYMRIAREFGGGQVSLSGKTAADAFAELSYSQILPLLGMAEEEREELAEEHDLPSMSSREIAALVKERDEAKANADKLKEKDKLLRSKLREANEERDKAQSSLSDATQREKDLAERLDELEKRPAEVRELTEEELEEIREKARAENAEAARAAEDRARAAEEKLDKAKNPAAHKVNFLFGELRGVEERLEQALEELQASDEAACEKFAKVIADWLRKEGDKLA
jgi:DNA repair exonuclease SbcCD ATPase subunit